MEFELAARLDKQTEKSYRWRRKLTTFSKSAAQYSRFMSPRTASLADCIGT